MNEAELTAARIGWVQVGPATGIDDAGRTRPVSGSRSGSVPGTPTKCRGLILADGFYERQRAGDGKRPMRTAMETRELFACAGIRETRKDPEGNLLDRERARLRMSSETGTPERLRHMLLAGRAAPGETYAVASRQRSRQQRTGTVKRCAA